MDYLIDNYLQELEQEIEIVHLDADAAIVNDDIDGWDGAMIRLEQLQEEMEF